MGRKVSRRSQHDIVLLTDSLLFLLFPCWRKKERISARYVWRVELIMTVIHYGQNQLNVPLLFLILHLNCRVYETQDRVWIPGNNFISKCACSRIARNGRKAADNQVFKGFRSLSIVLQLISTVDGVRQGCPRSEQARSLRFGQVWPVIF